MIILNSQKDNTNIKEILKKYKKMINLPYLECPFCNSTDLIKWGTYKRNIYYIDVIIKHEILLIQRIRCNKCGKTHALLPSFIIPYKLHFLDIILYGISNNEITLNISIDTITKWNKDFNKFLPYLKTMFNNIKKEEIITKIKEKIFVYYEQFYIKYKKILLMIRYGIYNIAHF